jgi:hypothetical protein
MKIAQAASSGRSSSVKNIASDLYQRLATPLATVLFLVSSVSGVALFFHWMPNVFHSMHEWLSVTLLAPLVVLHVWRNRRPLVAYARRGAFYVPLALALAVAAPFAVAGMVSGGADHHSLMRSASLLTQTRLVDLAPVLKTTPDELLKALGERGVATPTLDDTLEGVATASGRNASEMLLSVMPKQ